MRIKFHILLFLVMEAILTGQVLFNLETKKCKNSFETNLVISIQRLLSFVIFMFCAIFSNGRRRPYGNAKLQKVKIALHKKHSSTKLDKMSTKGS